MEPGHPEHPSWTCHTCHRRVPGRVQACRCGAVRPDRAGQDDVPAQAVEPARPRSFGLFLLLAGLLLGMAMSLLSIRTAAPAPSTTPPATTPTTASPGAGTGPWPFATSVAGMPVPEPVPEPEAPSVPPVAVDPVVLPERPADPVSLEDLVSRVVPAVATITAGNSRGTGFFIAPDQVVTNQHVVDGQTSVRLQVGDASYTAWVVSTSSATGLALLKVLNPSRTQPVLRLGTASSARVGQEVIAVGSALGVLSNTVTRGIVSAMRRAGTVTLLQTDAAINPGNSGGPLIDRTGVVIGVNSLRAAQGAEGVAFAVAIDHASQLLAGQTTAGSSTPLRSLTSLMGNPTGGDQQRIAGEQELARALAPLARRGDQLDAYWSRGAKMCVERFASAGDRPWFAAFQTDGVRLGTAAAPGCSAWIDEVRHHAAGIRSDIESAREIARRAGVYPGTVRSLLSRHRLQWSGWER